MAEGRHGAGAVAGSLGVETVMRQREGAHEEWPGLFKPLSLSPVAHLLLQGYAS